MRNRLVKTYVLFIVASMTLTWCEFSLAAEKSTYSPPRFPSYVKPLKSDETTSKALEVRGVRLISVH
jgi:hypothetical protein